ncbi:chemokine-like protein TAFA-5 isoform X1 [Tachysurus ichikawai]
MHSCDIQGCIRWDKEARRLAAKPRHVDTLQFTRPRIVKTKQWCDMVPCLDDEGCDLLVNRSGWTCTQPGGRVKTTTVSLLHHNTSL